MSKRFSGGGSQVNRVTTLAAIVGLLALLPGWGPNWLLLKANRLVAGDVYGAFALSGMSAAYAYALLGAWLLLLLSSLVRVPGRAWTLALLATLALFFGLLLAGEGSSALLAASGDPERARVSLQGGVWLTLLALYIGFFGALGDAPQQNQGRNGGRKRALMLLPGLVIAFTLLAAGTFNSVGLVQEFTTQGGDFAAEVLRHLALSGTSVLLACAVGIPAAIWAARREEAARLVLPTASFLQTIPSLALFGLMLLPLARLGSEVMVGTALLFCSLGLMLATGVGVLSRQFAGRIRGLFTLLTALVALLPVLLLTVMVAVLLNDAFVALFRLDFGALSLPENLGAPLSSLGVRGIGTAPALIALTLYAFLPVVRNTYTGIKEVPKSATEAGRGMGMSPGQILRRVELPLALPLMLEGVRASAVLTIGITTVAFLIGAGGLGTFIERGISQQVPDLILLGALPIIALALLADTLLRGLGQLLTPRGLR
jgi:osmoprotectant transport system permease protein